MPYGNNTFVASQGLPLERKGSIVKFNWLTPRIKYTISCYEPLRVYISFGEKLRAFSISAVKCLLDRLQSAFMKRFQTTTAI